MYDSKKQQEYQGLKDQKYSLSQRIDNLIKEKESILEKKRRLEAVYKAIDELKDQAKDAKKTDKKVNNKREWKGQNYNKFDHSREEMVTKDKNYIDIIDDIMDDINIEIAKLENEFNGQSTLIGKLSGQLNILNTKIQNFFN